MYKPFLYLLVVFAFSISVLSATELTYTIDKLYYGQVQFDEDSLEIKSYEFYMHLPVGGESNFYYRELNDDIYRKLVINESYTKGESDFCYFHYGDAVITLDTNSEIQTQIAGIKIRSLEGNIINGISYYKERDSVRVNLIATNPLEIAEIIKVPKNKHILPRPFDRFQNYWAAAYYSPHNNDFIIQGNMFSYLGNLGYEPYSLLSFTFPNISIVKTENDKYRVSYQALFFPAMSAIGGIVYVIHKETATWMFGGSQFLVAMFAAVTNPGIDYPIITSDHYVSLFFKINWDYLIVNENAKEFENIIPKKAFIEPKIGIRYLYKNGFGIESYAGYRFWNIHQRLAEENLQIGVGLLLPITDIDF